MAKSARSTDVLTDLYNDFFNQQSDAFDHLLESSAFAAFSLLPAGDTPTQAGHGLAVEAASSLSTSGVTTSLSSGAGFEWTGISFSSVEGYYYPPDNGLAVNHNAAPTVISAENGAIAATVFDSTQANYSQTIVSWTSFFSVKSGYSLSDPRALFDGTHFIVAVDEIKTSAGSSFLAYEVSSTDHPSVTTQTDWSSTVHISTTEAGTWADQPLVAVNGSYMYVTTNQFTSSGQYKGDYLTVISDYAGAATPTHFALDGPSYQTAVNSDGASSTELLVSHFSNGLHMLPVTGATLGTEVTLDTADGLLPEFGTGSFSVSQAGTNSKLDAGDGRITGAAFDVAHHALYAVFEIQPSSANSTPAVELVQVDTTTNHVTGALNLNTLLSASPLANASGSTVGAATFNASVAVDNQGDVIVNFNAASAKMYADDLYALWKATGPGAPSLTAPPSALVDYQAGQGAYVDPGHDKVGRWGDYSTAIADPNATNGFWISNEYDNGTVKVVGQPLSSWGTEIAHVLT